MSERLRQSDVEAVLLMEPVSRPEPLLQGRVGVERVAAHAKEAVKHDPSQPVDDFAALLDNIRLGNMPAMTEERRAITESAVAANEAREGEDIDMWAQQLAAMVAGAGD